MSARSRGSAREERGASTRSGRGEPSGWHGFNVDRRDQSLSTTDLGSECQVQNQVIDLAGPVVNQCFEVAILIRNQRRRDWREHPATDTTTSKYGVDHRAPYAAVAIREGVDAQEVEDGQRHQHQGVCPVLIQGQAVARDQVRHRDGREVRGNRTKADA